MPESRSVFTRSATQRYIMLGLLFGFLFPVLATVIEITTHRLPLGLSTVVRLHQASPLLWIIDTTPLFLGLMAAIAGRRQDVVQQLDEMLGSRQVELKSLQVSMEEKVNERTLELERANRQISRRASQLQGITELSAAIAQVQDLKEFFPAATRLISERFGFYHVGIFLIDEQREYVVLQAANSEGGARMLERGHRLPMGVGVVGFSAESGQPRIALDVGKDAVFFNNPDLPETRSEAALPLKVRGETTGVLDVQSLEPGAFSADDLTVLSALANQVSIGLENARLLTESRTAYQQMQALYDEFTRTEWGRTTSTSDQPGFRYQMGRIETLENALQRPEISKAVEKAEPVHDQSLAVPVTLRGNVIGVLHIESTDPHREWQDDEISLVQAVAERAAFAMENARLFQDARRRAAKERLISEATTRISSAFNVENILQTTAEELERVLGGSEISIQFPYEPLS